MLHHKNKHGVCSFLGTDPIETVKGLEAELQPKLQVTRIKCSSSLSETSGISPHVSGAACSGQLEVGVIQHIECFGTECKLTRSVILKFLNTDVSQETKLGPTKVFRPRLPTHPRHGVLNSVPALPQPLAH